MNEKYSLGGTNVAKPIRRDGEKDDEFTTRRKGQHWKLVQTSLRATQDTEEDQTAEDTTYVMRLLEASGIDPDWAKELQGMYDQFYRSWVLR